jgi:hypothetical protein
LNYFIEKFKKIIDSGNLALAITKNKQVETSLTLLDNFKPVENKIFYNYFTPDSSKILSSSAVAQSNPLIFNAASVFSGSFNQLQPAKQILDFSLVNKEKKYSVASLIDDYKNFYLSDNSKSVVLDLYLKNNSKEEKDEALLYKIISQYLYDGHLDKGPFDNTGPVLAIFADFLKDLTTKIKNDSEFSKLCDQDPDIYLFIKLFFCNCVEVQFIDSFNSVTTRNPLDIRDNVKVATLKNPLWKPLDFSTKNTLINNRKNLIVRLVPRDIPFLGYSKDRRFNIPIMNQYFVLTLAPSI